MGEAVMNEHELLESYRPWLRSAARRLVRIQQQRHIEDVAQEGWVAIWREAQRLQGLSAQVDRAWLRRVAINRMKDVLKATSASIRDEGRLLLLDDLTQIWEGAQLLGDVELAYHHGEIARALASLTVEQRRYVELRFYRGWQKAELNAFFRRDANSIWRVARPLLAKELAHLAPPSFQPKVDGRSLRYRKTAALTG
jgi:RNA polymerase sigma factor (sigma-70 family)